jgi:hypothetical protein
VTRLDWHGQVAQKVIWTPPLDHSRRVDQDPYIECPIRSPGERDMASGRFAVGHTVKPGPGGGLTGLPCKI